MNNVCTRVLINVVCMGWCICYKNNHSCDTGNDDENGDKKILPYLHMNIQLGMEIKTPCKH